jgi:hypothetical protein
MAAADVVDAYVAGLPGEHRALTPTEWGLSLPADAGGGWPLDVGLRIADGLLRVQAMAAAHDERLDPWGLLHWNRQTRLVRFACSRNGDIWVHAEVPVGAVTEEMVDRLLGLVTEGALAVRGLLANSGNEEAP